MYTDNDLAVATCLLDCCTQRLEEWYKVPKWRWFRRLRKARAYRLTLEETRSYLQEHHIWGSPANARLARILHAASLIGLSKR